MNRKNKNLKKGLLVALLLSLGLILLPATSTSAASLADEVPPITSPEADDSRLEEMYSKLVNRYERQTSWMEKADGMTTRVENLIEKASARGFDTSDLQAALDTFNSAYAEAHRYNQLAGEILDAHEGFNGSGKVKDREQAIETLKSLRDALRGAYEAMGGEAHAGRLLREAIRTLLKIMRPGEAPLS